MLLIPKYNKLSLTKNIVLAGILIALAVVGQKLLAINYIPALPFLRISFFGPATIIFASVLLGPILGAVVGLASDLLGYLIFDPKNNAFFFQITLIYFALGLLSYFIFWIVRKIKYENLLKIIMIVFLAAIITAVTLVLALNDQITLFSTTYNIDLFAKIFIPCLLFLLFSGLLVFVFVFGHYQKIKGKEVFCSSTHIAFGSLLCDFFVLVLFGSIMKGWAFGFSTYLVILFVQIAVMMVNVVFDTVIMNLIFRFFGKTFIKTEKEEIVESDSLNN